jgi:hypothetical protein
MEASYELKFELQVQIMRLIVGTTLDCQAYMPVHTTPHLDSYIYRGPECTAASDWTALLLLTFNAPDNTHDWPTPR